MFGNSDQGGYSVLAQSDDNHDGVIDANDPAFSQLLVWRDANHNGTSEVGELAKLGDAAAVPAVLPCRS